MQPNGYRLAWNAGGAVERLFLAWPWIWLSYVASIGVVGLVASTQRWLPSSFDYPDALWRLILVGVSFIFLAETWIAGSLSSGVLQALAANDPRTDSANALALSKYLLKRYDNGRWRVGNRMGISYMLFLLVWALVAWYFTDLSGIAGFEVFFALNLAVILVLFLAFQRQLGKLITAARSAGFELQLRNQPWFVRVSTALRPSKPGSR